VLVFCGGPGWRRLSLPDGSGQKAAVQRPENAITNQPGSKAFLFAQKYAMLYQKQLRPGAAEKGV
jgi:hypothetical protein